MSRTNTLNPTAGVNPDWRSRLVARYPLAGVMPGWLVVAVLVLPAAGFWLGLRLHAEAEPRPTPVVVAPMVADAVAAGRVARSFGLRRLRFIDMPDRSVRVVDADSGREVGHVSGEAGFFRGILRGLARERRRLGHGADVPFELSLDHGLLSLRDLATGQRIELTAFGSTNAAVFARFLVTVETIPPESAP